MTNILETEFPMCRKMSSFAHWTHTCKNLDGNSCYNSPRDFAASEPKTEWRANLRLNGGHLSLVENDSFVSSFPVFVSLIPRLAWILHGGQQGRPCPISDFKEKASSISTLNTPSISCLPRALLIIH
jgi:hypothetical protein